MPWEGGANTWLGAVTNLGEELLPFVTSQWGWFAYLCVFSKQRSVCAGKESEPQELGCWVYYFHVVYTLQFVVSLFSKNAEKNKEPHYVFPLSRAHNRCCRAYYGKMQRWDLDIMSNCVQRVTGALWFSFSHANIGPNLQDGRYTVLQKWCRRRRRRRAASPKESCERGPALSHCEAAALLLSYLPLFFSAVWFKKQALIRRLPSSNVSE